ncbi:MAG: (d)CMP kinase [Clostridiales bacterium]|nr:(d)CMP kinase [Candidatus Crickella merdequi]
MLRVAIDGPGGAGKSTIAKFVADKYGLDYVDTGAMYRAVALNAIRNNIDQADEPAISSMLENTVIDFNGTSILLNGEDVSGLIRTQEVSMAASNVSKLGPVRTLVSRLSGDMAKTKDLVMDGRDIGTNVITDAEVKIFLTASPEVRAKRRYDQLIEAGKEADYDTILEEIEQRDYQDTHRELNPLKQADDAVLLDTSYMTIEEVVSSISQIIDDKVRG